MKHYLLTLGLFFLSLCHAAEIKKVEEATDWKRVYLATYPRSGNHWMRYLIEEATGIVTGSVRPGAKHLRKPFPWGAYSTNHGYQGNCRYPEKGEIVVIKTHYPVMPLAPFDLVKSIKTVRVVRNPIDSFYSWSVYKNKGQDIEFISNETLEKCIRLHKRFQNYWNRKGVFTVRYEDLLLHPYRTLSLILRKIGYRVSSADIRRAIEKYPPYGYELKHIAHFTPEQLQLIQTELKDFLEQFDYHIPNSN
jgi:hypothetical protein